MIITVNRLGSLEFIGNHLAVVDGDGEEVTISNCTFEIKSSKDLENALEFYSKKPARGIRYYNDEDLPELKFWYSSLGYAPNGFCF